MTFVGQTSTDQTIHNDEELRQAELRADRAEKELQAVRHTVEELKSRQQNSPGWSTTSSSGNTGEPVSGRQKSDDPIQVLRGEPMMAHLLDALDEGKDIGHYGRLVFVMVSRLFLSRDQVIAWLTKDHDFSEEAANAMVQQVEARDYNPPRRERILEWQSEQEFPIIPNTEDPDCGNVYRTLKFPQRVYHDIQEYQEKKAEASG
jgi:hypothetical protein